MCSCIEARVSVAYSKPRDTAATAAEPYIKLRARFRGGFEELEAFLVACKGALCIFGRTAWWRSRNGGIRIVMLAWLCLVVLDGDVAAFGVDLPSAGLSGKLKFFGSLRLHTSSHNSTPQWRLHKYPLGTLLLEVQSVALRQIRRELIPCISESQLIPLDYISRDSQTNYKKMTFAGVSTAYAVPTAQSWILLP